MKKTVILLSVLVVLAAAAVLVGPGLVDWSRYKDQVTRRIGTVTGLQVVIDGDMDLALLPKPTFQASGVRIAGLSGTVAPDMASVEELQVRVALMPLLGGEIQVERVALLRPFLVVETLPDGGSNWSPGPGGGRLASSVRLERVNIQDGTLVWRDLARGREERIEDVDISLSAVSLSGPLQVVGDATVRGLPLTLDLSAGRATSAGAMPMGLTLGLQDAPGTVHLAGIASLRDGFQGELTGEAGSLAGLFEQLWPGRPVPATLQRPFAVEAALRLTGDSIALNALTVDLGETRATGAIGAAFGAVPGIDVALTANRIDLDAWLATLSDGAGPLVSLAGSMAGEFALPAGVAATVDVAVDAITYRGALVRQARIEGFLSDGIVAVSRLTAQLPGGSDMALAGTLRAEDGVPHFDFDAQAAANDLRGVLGWLGHAIDDVPNARLRRFSGSASISGRPDDFQVAGFEFVIDGTRATGGLAYVNHGRPGIGLRLDASRLNLDAYRLPDAGALLERATLDRLVAMLGAVDANLDIGMAGLTIDGLTLRDIRLDATVNDGAITVRRAGIGDAAGASLSLNGSLLSLDPLAGADLAFDFIVPDPGRLARGLGMLEARMDGLKAVSLAGRLAGGADALALELAAGLAGGTVEIGGSIGTPWETPAFDLAIRARHPDLDALLAAWAPAYRPVGPLGPVDLFGELTGMPEYLAVDSLQGTVGSVTLAGQFRINRTAEQPFVEAVLRASELAVDPWLARSPRGRTRSARRWSNEAYDLSALGRFDGSLALTALGLTAGRFRLAEPALEAHLAAGVFELTALSGRMFGGSLGASGRLEVGDRRSALGLKLDLVGADLAEALATAADVTEFGGALDFGLDVEMSGASPAELVGNLQGSGLFAARDGRVQGIDLAEAAAGLGSLTDPLEFLDLQQHTLTAGSTAFAAINATFELADGIASTEDLRLVGEAGAATGRGVFDLSRWQIDLTTEFGLSGMPEAPSFGVRLIGPPDDPERVLQTAELQAFIARRAADAVSRRFNEGQPDRRPPPAPIE